MWITTWYYIFNSLTSRDSKRSSHHGLYLCTFFASFEYLMKSGGIGGYKLTMAVTVFLSVT